MCLEAKIRDVFDFPIPGICFKDITTLIKDGSAFREAVEQLANPFQGEQIDLIVAPEARGFLLGAPVAFVLGAGFVPVRKPGKLPAEVVSYHYDLEYGQDILEIHKDSIQPGQNVLIVDDLLATGGTIKAVANLVQELGGVVKGFAFLVELSELNGRKELSGNQIVSLVTY